MGKRVILIGGGGHAKVLMSTLMEVGIGIGGIYDDDPQKHGKDLLGSRIIGPISMIDSSFRGDAVLGVGDNITRRTLADRLNHLRWVTVVHPRAFVHRSVTLGEGTVIFAGAVVQPDVVVGRHCIVNTNAAIDHDCILGDYVHLAPGTCLAGNVSVGEGAVLGAGGVGIIGITIGRWSVLGAGAVATTNIPDNVTAVGVPARVIKKSV